MSSSVICRPAFGNTKNRKRHDCDLAWRRDGAGWVLLYKRRRMGRVLPDDQHRGMYRSVLSRGRLSDMASLSWAKNAVLVAAERELEFEHRSRPTNDPSKCPEKGGVLRLQPCLSHQRRRTGIRCPGCVRVLVRLPSDKWRQRRGNTAMDDTTDRQENQ